MPMGPVFTTKDRVLRLLAGAGDYISGEGMSENIGVSRAAVNAAVAKLREEGYEITSVTNRGYRLESSPNALTAAAVSLGLPPQRMERVLCMSVIDSTNKKLMELAADGAPDGFAVIADEQTAGRGRVGKSFASPAGKGIYLSYLIRPDIAAGESAMLGDWVNITGKTAVAVSDAILESTGALTGIKWVNDLYMNGKKLCGILTQTDTEAETGAVRSMVIGIGVNVLEDPDDFPPEIRSIASSLKAETGKEHGRADIAASMIRNLDKMRQRLRDDDDYYLNEYRRRCTSTGRDIAMAAPGGEEHLKAVGISDSFGLIVEDAAGTVRELAGGEILRYL